MELICGDCLDEMANIPDNSIDFILTDLPYGTTACNWDNIIPFGPMWEHIKRITKNNSAIALFGSNPFSSRLVSSNLEMFKYGWVWDKQATTGFQHAKNMPLKQTEDIMMFSKGVINHSSIVGERRMRYYPQGVTSAGEKIVGRKPNYMGQRPNQEGKRYQSFTGYPNNILRFKRDQNPVHPTQKPVDLLEYLIKTYTIEGDVVLDFTMGCGSAGVAAVNTRRDFIGIELNREYFDIAQKRICN